MIDPASPLLQVEDVARHFGGNAAVSACTFAVWQREIVGLIGPNGAGKSTVFNLIAGELHPDSGTIRFDAKPIQELAPNRVARLGIRRTFQIPRPLSALTVAENLLLVPEGQFGERLDAVFRGRRRVREEEAGNSERAREVLALLELEGLASHPARSLSGGQKKLLELGRCLMADPRLVLLDEPTAGVNPRLINDLMKALHRIHELGVTILVIEHNMNVVMSLSDRIVVMDQGSVLMEGTPAQVRQDQRVLDAYLGGS